jgi:hypothetical protein
VESPPGMIPIVRFGRFSAVFEPTGSYFNLETAVRAAAFVTLPGALGIGSAWEFAVTEDRLLVATRPFRASIDVLVGWLEDGSLSSASLRDRFGTLCGWTGWSVLARRSVAPDELLEALRHCVSLNQLVWAATAAKDPLAERYRAFLAERLDDLDEADRERMFLNTLIMPDRSYILRHWLAGDGQETTWSGATGGARGAEQDAAESAAAARVLHRDAAARHGAALRQLRSRLTWPEFERAASYVACLADLVDLAERKNTDLHRCNAALFGHPDHRAAIAALCGIGDPDREDGTTGQARRRTVERFVELVQARGDTLLGQRTPVGSTRR